MKFDIKTELSSNGDCDVQTDKITLKMATATLEETFQNVIYSLKLKPYISPVYLL
jgi:hypothetical protein